MPKDIDAGLVRRLVREQFPHWGDQPIAPVSQTALSPPPRHGLEPGIPGFRALGT